MKDILFIIICIIYFQGVYGQEVKITSCEKKENKLIVEGVVINNTVITLWFLGVSKQYEHTANGNWSLIITDANNNILESGNLPHGFVPSKKSYFELKSKDTLRTCFLIDLDKIEYLYNASTGKRINNGVSVKYPLFIKITYGDSYLKHSNSIKAMQSNVVKLEK